MSRVHCVSTNIVDSMKRALLLDMSIEDLPLSNEQLDRSTGQANEYRTLLSDY